MWMIIVMSQLFSAAHGQTSPSTVISSNSDLDLVSTCTDVRSEMHGTILCVSLGQSLTHLLHTKSEHLRNIERMKVHRGMPFEAEELGRLCHCHVRLL